MEEPKQPRRNAAKKALESNGFADNDEEREEEEEEEELDEDVYGMAYCDPSARALPGS